MKNKLVAALILLFCTTANGQLFDNYGIKLGTCLSNQYWNYKYLASLSAWNAYKFGLIGLIYAEKNISPKVALRPSLGYIQKGYGQQISIIQPDGKLLAIVDNNAVFHNLSIDFALKVSPFEKPVKPYIYFGFRWDYLLGVTSVIDYNGEEVRIGTQVYAGFSKLTMGALLGIGVSFKNLVTLELDYNPGLTKNYNSNEVVVNEECFGLTVGLYIDRFLVKHPKSPSGGPYDSSITTAL